MAALDFPASPSDGDTYAGYTYNGTVGAWQWDTIDPSTSFAPKYYVETSEQTANYTLALTDLNKVVLMNGTSLTVTVPTNASVAFPVGSIVNIYNTNSTDVTVSGDSGVTVRNNGTVGQYAEASLRKRDTDEWVMVGG